VLTTVAGRAAAIARAGVPDHVYVAVRPRIERLLGLQERELSYLLQAKSPGRRRFVDVGANWGSYTVLLAPSFAHTDAFEPIIRCAAALEKYAALRGGRIHVHPCALSDVNDTLALLVPEDGVVDASGRSRIVETGDSSTVDISARTLDSFGFDDVDLVKIDVEGHERSVIAGARETLLRCKPTRRPLATKRLSFVAAAWFRSISSISSAIRTWQMSGRETFMSIISFSSHVRVCEPGERLTVT
jgi:FkbM family methyltransferase